jgi:hypothetical protein
MKVNQRVEVQKWSVIESFIGRHNDRYDKINQTTEFLNATGSLHIVATIQTICRHISVNRFDSATNVNGAQHGIRRIIDVSV